MINISAKSKYYRTFGGNIYHEHNRKASTSQRSAGSYDIS